MKEPAHSQPGGTTLSKARYPFAPGVIQGGTSPLERTGVPLLIDLAIAVACMAGAAALAGFVAGYFGWMGALL